jgi:hypothetical protein
MRRESSLTLAIMIQHSALAMDSSKSLSNAVFASASLFAALDIATGAVIGRC